MVGEKEYLSCAETAKLVRTALKREFPGIKFSVRSKTYSGGASISVYYTDGPTSREVERVVGKFAGADFDGMIDLKTHTDHWLMPDGTVEVAHAWGTESSRGYIPEVINSAPSPNAKLVSFGADYVFIQRDTSDEWNEEVLAEFERVLDRPLPRERNDWWRTEVPLKVDRDGRLLHMIETEKESLSTVVHQYTGTRNRTTGEVVAR